MRCCRPSSCSHSSIIAASHSVKLSRELLRRLLWPPTVFEGTLIGQVFKGDVRISCAMGVDCASSDGDVVHYAPRLERITIGAQNLVLLNLTLATGSQAHAQVLLVIGSLLWSVLPRAYTRTSRKSSHLHSHGHKSRIKER